jgi:DNA invertase Pin-like site-specific DNA recombinase
MSRAKLEAVQAVVAPVPAPAFGASGIVPSGRLLGYARVSTDGQSLAAQLDQLHAAGAGKVYRETASGAKRDRAQLAKLLAEVEHGDVVAVTRLDRLARSTRDLLNVLGSLAEKGAMFRSLADPWADTTPPMAG